MFTGAKSSTAAVFSAVARPLSGAANVSYSTSRMAFFAGANPVACVRPGLILTIPSGQPASNGTASMAFALPHPQGPPPDRAGVPTPRAVSPARTPVACITRSATGENSGTKRKVTSL